MAVQQEQLQSVGNPYTAHAPRPVGRRRLEKYTMRFGNFLLHYWAHLITGVMGLLVLTALLIPFLSYLGLDVVAKPLFYSLHLVCAQIPAHSFYILGHQLGLCARNLSIYSSMTFAGLVFILTKKRMPGLPWWLWALMLLPIAWDGLNQMFGLRQSTWELRVLTGTLFGLANIWFIFPLIQKTLMEAAPPQTPATR